MTDTFWARVRAAFDAVVDAAPGDVETAVRDAAGGDDAVRREVMALLALDPGNFLAPCDDFAVDAALLATQLAPGTVVGGYRIVGMVGRGGMGEVYDAFRTGDDFTKQVAIKVLGVGATGPDAVRRFQKERRILAGLNHRNIALLLDGGLLADGRPYLVMEFVAGEPVTTWCTSHHLSLDDRLVLFRQICGAVSHAHRNLIVHRDLKPGNILVASDGTVKLLDFGIAKVLDPDPGLDSEVTETRPEAAALTPEYAAPEQLAGGPITTATDVYALGLLLYELLTGSRPFATRGQSVPELARLVLTTDPPMPSTAVNPERLGMDASVVRRHLRGDLDAILLKTLRTDPAARYGTVDELADDLRRHQDGRPVRAMQGHRGYRLGKFAVRNRVALIGAAVVVVALASGAISTWRESQRTNIQRVRAETTNRFLTDMLSSVDPAAEGKEVPMVQVLDSAAARITGDSSLEPEVEASLQAAIGASYRSLGKYAAAEPHLERALALRERRTDDPIALSAAVDALAQLHDDRGEYAAADSLFARAGALLPNVHDSSLEAVRTHLLAQRARMQSLAGSLPRADSMLREVVARQRAQFGDASDQAANALAELGVTLVQRHKLPGADSAERQALAIYRRLHPRPHPDVGKTLGRLASVLDQEGNRAAADSAYRESLTLLAATLGADHPDVAWIRYNYAGFLVDGSEWDGAIREIDSVLMLRGVTIPETHTTIAASLTLRGDAHAARGDHLAAIGDYRESLALRRKYLPPTHWLIGSSESKLGGELLETGARAEAILMLRDGCRLITKALGAAHPVSKKAQDRLAKAGDRTACS